MDSYVDLRIEPQQEQKTSNLLGSVFGQLHYVLVDRDKGDVGVSFPKAHAIGLGDTLRLHSQTSVLEEVISAKRMHRLNDYYRTSAISGIPNEHQWRVVKRQQPKMTASKVRRLLARGSISIQEAEAYCSTLTKISLPFLQLTSASTGQPFKLFIEQVESEAPLEVAKFNTYGFGGRIPWF